MSFDACKSLVKSGDPDRYLSARSAPAEGHKALMAIYAVNLEIARAPWASQEPLVAQMRLRWWGDEIAKIYRGEVVNSHEILPALREVIFDHNLPQTLFESLVEARHFDIFNDPHASIEAFNAYIDATAGGVMELAARALGAGPDALPTLRDFAFASGVASLMRAAPALIARGRAPLPEDMETIIAEALSRLRAARANRAAMPKAATPALLAGWRASAALTEAQKRPHSIAAGLLEESPARKMASLRWRTLTGRW